MNINILKNIKNQFETRVVNNRIKNFTDEEKENLNKIINFAITWWLQDVNGNCNKNCGDNYIDVFYATIKKQPLTKEQIIKLESFKYNFGISILKKLVLNDEDIILHCGYTPDGILGKIIQENKCEFLDLHLPNKSTMTINKQQIWIKEGYGAKKCLAFDVNQIIAFENKDTYENLSEEEKTEKILKKIDDVILIIQNGELILPNNFTPSTYDYVSSFLNNSNIEKNNHVKKYTR